MIVKVPFEHNSYNWEKQDYSGSPSGVIFSFHAHKHYLGNISFDIVDDNEYAGFGFTNCFSSNEFDFCGKDFKKPLNEICKYISKYNRKWNTNYDKIVFYLEFKTKNAEKYLEEVGFIKILKNNKELWVYEI